VLVTGPGREPGTATGRTSCHRLVHFAVDETGGAAVGRMAEVLITRALPHSLLGEPVSSLAP
jgi:tRNA A37 methylthiotransferase MiaB